MRIGFVSKGSLREFHRESENRACACAGEEGKKVDLWLFGFEGLGEVSYEKELKGESDFFEDIALFSKREQSVVACGCITDTRGLKRKSVVVAQQGKILGVSDMLNAVDGELNGGAAVRVYETKVGRMGVAVADDLHFPDIVRSLSVCGCDFIVCPYGLVLDSVQSVLLRAYAYCYGIPIFFCAKGYSMIADITGKISFASPQSPVCTDFKNIREYHLIQTRKRGVFRPVL